MVSINKPQSAMSQLRTIVLFTLYLLTVIMVFNVDAGTASPMVEVNSADITTGMYANGDDNSLTNLGTITCDSSSGFKYGIYVANGDNNKLINDGTIHLSGYNDEGLYGWGDFNTLINTGSIITEGSNSYGTFLAESNHTTVTNSGTISTTGSDADAMRIGFNTSSILKNTDNTLTNNGTISTLGLRSSGLMAIADNNNLINDGTIITQGDEARGLYVHSSNNTLTNNNSISTLGRFSYGIFSYRQDNLLTNSGKITTSGEQGIAIFGRGINNTLDNSGTITTTGASAWGIYVKYTDNTVTNSGEIFTAGSFGYGLYASGSANTLTNSGTINTTGDFGHGIVIREGSNSLFHSGNIEVTGADSLGIFAREGDNLIDISGDIASQQAAAIRMGGYWNNGAIEQTENTGNQLFVHGTSNVQGDIINDGAVDGAVVYFGSRYDIDSNDILNDAETSFIFNDDFSGRAWRAEVQAGQVTLNGNNDFSSLNVHNGAQLSGNGTINGNVNNSGEISLGDGIGTLNINGTYSQSAAGTLTVGVASANHYDCLTVAGDATLDGTLRAQLLVSYVPANGDRLTVLCADTITGSFAVEIENPELTPTLALTTHYDGNQVVLAVDRNYQNTALINQLNSNQNAILTAMSNGVDNASGDFDQVLAAIDCLSDNRQVATALDSLSEQSSTAQFKTSFAVGSVHAANLSQRLTTVRAGSGISGGQSLRAAHNRDPFNGILLASTDVDLNSLGIFTKPPAKDFGLFMTAKAVLGRQSTSTNQTGYDFTTTVLTFGGDRVIGDSLIVGIFAGLHETKTNFSHTSSDSEGEGGTLGLYASRMLGKFYVDASLGYSLNSYDNQRRIRFSGIDRTASSNPNGNLLSLYGGIGRNYNLGGWDIAPHLSVQYLNSKIDSYTESGADSLNLAVASQRSEVWQPGIGAKISNTYTTSYGAWSPSFSASYQHRYGDNSSHVSTQLNEAQTPVFHTETAGVSDNFGAAAIGITALFNNNTTLNLEYSAMLGDGNYREQSVQLGMRCEF